MTKRILAVGSIRNGDTELRGLSLYHPGKVVEHTVNRWTPETWVAEVRVDCTLKQRAHFSGDNAIKEANEWCERVEPMDENVYRSVRV